MHFPERIYGIENEFGVAVRNTSGAFVECADPPVWKLIQPIEYSIRNESPSPGRIWHSNGSCTYIDMGCHPEHATAECRSVRDVVRHNKAGEFLASRIFTRDIGIGELHLFKNNLGCNEEGAVKGEYGCHENYLLRGQHASDKAHIMELTPFLVSRQILDGSGWWEQQGAFLFSQRSLSIVADIGAGTTNQRPIINIKNTNDTGPGRLHLILGDANILEFALYLKIGTTSLVLSLLEARKMPSIICTNPVAAMRDIAKSYDALEKTIHFRDCLKSPFDVQTIYWEAVKNELPSASFGSEKIEAETHHIMLCWEQTLNAIYNRDTQWMLGRLDYATKKYLSDKEVRRRQPADTDDLFSLRKDIDILYHGISDRTLQDRMNTAWSGRRLLTDKEIADAVIHPPSGTRAQLRGKLIQRMCAVDQKSIFELDWIMCRFMLPKTQLHQFTFPDPFVSHSQAFNIFLTKMGI
ncbi:MAG: proteasome accessory factor PafA2 family protein [bacterium]|nr:proteasome accessory factor PafA2 family protein [bacterium]